MVAIRFQVIVQGLGALELSVAHVASHWGLVRGVEGSHMLRKCAGVGKLPVTFVAGMKDLGRRRG